MLRGMSLQNPANLDYSFRRAQTKMGLGINAHHRREWKEAQLALGQALDSLTKLADQFDGIPKYRIEQARANYYLGYLFKDRRDPAEAKQFLNQARRLLNGPIGKHPRAQDLLKQIDSLGL